MSIKHFFRRFHRWIGLIVGIQILAWTSGGFVMSYLPIEKVRGEHNINEKKEKPLSANDVNIPIHQLLELQNGKSKIVEIKLKRLSERSVYEALDVDGKLFLVDAKSGERLSPLSKEMAMILANNDFKGEARPVSIEWIKETNNEYRNTVPVWMVKFDDQDDTHLYISPQNGEILARRNSTWRLYDFFWMLHIMDYKHRTNFNHPLLITAAVAAICLGLSGIVLIFVSFRKRDFRYLIRASPKGG